MKPSCIGTECTYYCTDPDICGCLIGEDDRELLNVMCPCENGEFENLFGENGELYNG